jgi:hypothetical protein
MTGADFVIQFAMHLGRPSRLTRGANLSIDLQVQILDLRIQIQAKKLAALQTTRKVARQNLFAVQHFWSWAKDEPHS